MGGVEDGSPISWSMSFPSQIFHSKKEGGLMLSMGLQEENKGDLVDREG